MSRLPALLFPLEVKPSTAEDAVGFAFAFVFIGYTLWLLVDGWMPIPKTNDHGREVRLHLKVTNPPRDR